MSNGLIRIEDLHDSIKEPQYDTTQTITSEVTRLNCLNKNLVSLVITGKTVVNIMGTDGDCENTNNWTTQGNSLPSIALDSSNKVFGTNSIRSTSTGTGNNAIQTVKKYPVNNTKYYALSMYLKSNSPNATYFHAIKGSDGTALKTVGLGVIPNTFNRYFKKISPTDLGTETDIYINITSQFNALEQSFNVDGIMLEEITQAQYNDPNWQLSPYVNSDMSVGYVVTRIKSRGKNLLNLVQGSVDSNGKSIPNVSYVTHKDGAIVVRPNTTYSFSMSSALNYVIHEFDNNHFLLDANPWTTTPTTGGSFTTGPYTKYLAIVFRIDTTSTIYAENYQIMMNEGSIALAYEPYEETYAPIQLPLRDIKEANVRDSIEGNKYIKRIEKVILDGSLNYSTVNLGIATGYKAIWIPSSFTNAVYNQAVLVKYNNKNIPIIKSVWNEGEIFEINYNNLGNLNIVIPNSDSGWGDSYTPTPQEIQAYFNGWKMADGNSATNAYNGTGTKYWHKIGQLGINPVTTCPTVINDAGYTPYRLYYPLATPIITEINMPSLVAFPGGDLIMESDSQSWVRPNVTYTLCKSCRANLDEVMKGLSDGRRKSSDYVIKSNNVSDYTDLNTIITSGFYRTQNNCVNRPSQCNWGQLLVVRGGGDTITQIYGDYSTGNLYTRSGNPLNIGGGGSWTPWRQIISESGGTMLGILTAQSNTSYTTRQVHNMILSPNDADVNAMQNGDIWCKYK
jgi:hypothetical protein